MLKAPILQALAGRLALVPSVVLGVSSVEVILVPTQTGRADWSSSLANREKSQRDALNQGSHARISERSASPYSAIVLQHDASD
jgi:hypothetical protein